MLPGSHRSVISIDFHTPREQAKAGVFNPDVHEELANSVAQEVQSLMSAQIRAETLANSMHNQKINHLFKNSDHKGIATTVGAHLTMPPFRRGVSMVPEEPPSNDQTQRTSSKGSDCPISTSSIPLDSLLENDRPVSEQGEHVPVSPNVSPSSARSPTLSSPRFSPRRPLAPIRTLARPSLSAPHSARSSGYPGASPADRAHARRMSMGQAQTAGERAHARRTSIGHAQCLRLSQYGQRASITIPRPCPVISSSSSDARASSIGEGGAGSQPEKKGDEQTLAEIQELEEMLNAKKALLKRLDHRRKSEVYARFPPTPARSRSRFCSETWNQGDQSPQNSLKSQAQQSDARKSPSSRPSLQVVPPLVGQLPIHSRHSHAQTDQGQVTPRTPRMYCSSDAGRYTPQHTPRTPFHAPCNTPRACATPRQYHLPPRERAISEKGPLMLKLASDGASDLTGRSAQAEGVAGKLREVEVRPVPVPQKRTGPYLVHTPLMKSPAINNLISTNRRLKYSPSFCSSDNFGPLMKSISGMGSNTGMWKQGPTAKPAESRPVVNRTSEQALGGNAPVRAPSPHKGETASPSTNTRGILRPIAVPQLRGAGTNAGWKLPNLGRAQLSEGGASASAGINNAHSAQTGEANGQPVAGQVLNKAISSQADEANGKPGADSLLPRGNSLLPSDSSTKPATTPSANKAMPSQAAEANGMQPAASFLSRGNSLLPSNSSASPAASPVINKAVPSQASDANGKPLVASLLNRGSSLLPSESTKSAAAPLLTRARTSHFETPVIPRRKAGPMALQMSFGMQMPVIAPARLAVSPQRRQAPSPTAAMHPTSPQSRNPRNTIGARPLPKATPEGNGRVEATRRMKSSENVLARKGSLRARLSGTGLHDDFVSVYSDSEETIASD